MFVVGGFVVLLFVIVFVVFFGVCNVVYGMCMLLIVGGRLL